MIKFITIVVLALIWIGCSGRSPESTWTAEEYYEYAKELYDDEDFFEATNELTVVILRYPGSAVADSAQFYLGMSHYNLEEYIISAAIRSSFESPETFMDTKIYSRHDRAYRFIVKDPSIIQNGMVAVSPEITIQKN